MELILVGVCVKTFDCEPLWVCVVVVDFDELVVTVSDTDCIIEPVLLDDCVTELVIEALFDAEPLNVFVKMLIPVFVTECVWVMVYIDDLLILFVFVKVGFKPDGVLLTL